jgi:phage shock protein PspC (stress-responsive transcriptional regulator)
MSTRTRRPARTEEDDLFLSDPLSSDILLEDVTDDDIEAFLEEQEPQKTGFWNLPTIAGFSIITVGVAYLLQQMGISAIPDVGTLIAALPWFAGALIILLGFGVLSWSPSRKKKVRARRRAAVSKTTGEATVVEKIEVSKEKRRLTKSVTNKKLAGVCGGLGEYFGVDPTLIRIAFVIATLMGGGFPAIPLYIVLAIIMSNPEKKRPGRNLSKASSEERIRVVRDSG